MSLTLMMITNNKVRRLNHLAMLPPSDITFCNRKTQKAIAEQHFISHELVIYFNYR